MAIWNVDVQKRLGSEFWTNRYIVRGTNIASAIITANAISEVERIAHSNLVTFVNHRVSDAGVSEEYAITPLNVAGLRGETNLLPLFNTLRVDIAAATGRPSRKFYRGVLGEVDINGEAVLGNTAFTDLVNGLVNLFSEIEGEDGLIDPQGTLFTGATLHPFVQMRQLRRGTRRRSTPVFQ